MSSLAVLLTRHELSEDPKDLVANALIRLSHSFSIRAQYFGVFYLVSHGVVKYILILLLWQKKLWAYPLTIASLILFVAYQVNSPDIFFVFSFNFASQSVDIDCHGMFIHKV